MPKVTFNNKKGNFHQTLKNAVEQYFQEKNISKTGDWRLYSKTIILIASAVGIYLSLILMPLPAWLGITLSGLLGFVLATIGFNVMHDANHGSYSKSKTINDLLGLTLNALGGNAFLWKTKHNIIHHTYTNVDGLDDDIAKSPLMRMAPTQVWVPAHRYQHIYVFFLYAISSFAWVFIMDLNKYFKQKVYTTPLPKMSFGEHFIFWMSKVMYVIFYIAIPVHFVGWAAWGVGFAVMHVIMGLTLSVVFQLAHVVEHTDFEYVENDKMVDSEWAVHQILTTANFSPDNKIVSWFAGGLNYQIEHHLFPRVSHVHYPAISKIVKELCYEYGIRYYEAPSVWSAIVSHVKMMKEFGKSPVLVNS
jgi:linoleoyl-CoA desaturase